MSTGSPSAYLLWAILATIFFCFLVLHLWLYDRFSCLRWDSGRQPGAFKRVMTYSYITTLPLLVCFSISMTVIKFQEGYFLASDGAIVPRPMSEWSPHNRRWLLPLFFTLSVAWSLELVTHLEELTFWLFLLHQGPGKRDWFHSWEFRTWYTGSVIAIVGMPLTAVVTRHELDKALAYIFITGATAGTSTTVCFLYVLFRFPRFLEYVKAEGADPDVVVRLATFYQLNVIRVAFRFLFTVPLLLVAADSITGPYPIVGHPFAADFLLMLAGMGCFISSAITLLIFFPRSVAQESGYRAKIISPETSAKPPTISSQPPSYHHHYQDNEYENPMSNPMSVLHHPMPPSPLRMSGFRFPQQQDRRRDSIESGDISLAAYDSDADSVAMSSHTLPHRVRKSMSQPGHSRSPSNHNSGSRSEDTMWDGRPHDGDTTSSSRRHSDGPFLYTRHGKFVRSVDRHSSQMPLRPRDSRRSSTLHPYVANFTSPIDLMDGRDDDRVTSV
ncbi:hypothetical protein FA15DRAFT_668226 [Coprinopsis marcescibilis]|uniref:Uncharacterized protein n=1 Tax=Coprinopsis marcescibilis TaxID=230819 RepID=A0A5C3KYJ3_COPMA|nr:hypothetical protein FA15DRAFT_668226 [Coprinopsis marcescibilis]